jgi:hypothetical protein
MTKLNQIIAIEKGVRARTTRRVTDLYHQFQKPALFSGLARTYRPRDDEGETLPDERTSVQLRAVDVLTEIAQAETELLDVVLTKDVYNTDASADIKVDGVTIATYVPVTYLLFLEKQLQNIAAILQKVPTLDPAETWHYDDATDLWRTEPTGTTRTKKIPRNHVKAEATDRHPAQVEIFTEDVVVGYWNRVLFSGALPASRVREYTERLDKLIAAVKYAREEANGITVEDRKIGDSLFRYLLG